MINPAVGLLTVTVLLAACVLLLWPVRGWLWRWLRALRATEKVLVEDALKHLFDCEYNDRVASLQSLSGVLAVTGNRAAEVVSRLQAEQLLTDEDGGYQLTSEGRTYALRIVRAHRLWERYLSDETGHDPEVWHERAERLEHTLSSVEVEELAAKMGHPRYDPHGDPIPTASGEIAPPFGQPLSKLAVGELAEIVHVEDEPEAVYAQLVAEGLHPGMRVRVHAVTPQRITFEADAEEHVLAPILAANLSVQVLPQHEEMAGPYVRLSSLNVGESGRVVAFAPRLQGPQRRRLLDLGLIPGTEVRAEIKSPSGEPTGYLIRGAVIALRRNQTDHIQIDSIKSASPIEASNQ